MKDLSSRLLAAALLGPMLFVVGTLLLFGSHSQAASSGGTGIVQVAFTSSPGSLTTSDGAAIPAEYSRVLLNVVAVRLNPSSDLTIPDSSRSWVNIPIPAPATAGTVMAQVDLEALPNLPFFFASASIPAKTYNQAELVLNPNSPGVVVPLCASAIAGCMPLSAKLKPELRVAIPDGFTVSRSSIQPLAINIGGILGPAEIVAPTIAVRDNGEVDGLPYNPGLGFVTGTVSNFDVKTTTVTAEFTGTNQIVATTKVLKDGSFSINLPALDQAGGGTFYDFYVSGNGGYVVRSQRRVIAQGASVGPPPITDLDTLPVPSSKFASIIGAVYDACIGTTKPVEGATLQLLVPDTESNPEITDCDLTADLTIPPNCVVVGTAKTNALGFYPFGGTSKFPQPFNHVPVTLPADVDHYTLEVNASGFNTVVREVKAGPHTLSCPDSGFKNNACKFNLEHGFIAGTVALSSPNDSGTTLNVMVNAEDAGTNKVENFAVARIPAGATSGSFSMPVPHGTPVAGARAAPAASPTETPSVIPVTSYDVFAVVQDFFAGTTQKISGHSIAVEAGITAPPPTPTPTPTSGARFVPASSTPTPAACPTVKIELPAADCAGIGQGSVFGAVSKANPNTTSVRLSKADSDGTQVQIDQTQPNSIGFASSPAANFYNFCAPADSYVVTRYESSSPGASPSPVSSAPVTLETPIPAPSPCTSVCSDQPCARCQNTAGPTL